MRRLRKIALALTNASAIVAAFGLIQMSPLPTPFTARSTAEPPIAALALPKLSEIHSLEELYQIRERILNHLEKSYAQAVKHTSKPSDKKLLQMLREVEVRILTEERASDNWEQAQRLAREAAEMKKNPKQSVETVKKKQLLLAQAIHNLLEIPKNSSLAGLIPLKIKEFEGKLTKSNYTVNENNFLEAIARESGLSKEAMITVCHISRYCVSLRGKREPASPASLIKIPIAVALLQKISEQNIDLDTEIYVQSGNFTEDASAIRSLQRYPLKVLLGEMIDHSSNIATNQLIDYLGYNYINKYLENSGYKVTRVNFKLMGERIMPWKPGSGRNRINSDELTEMMLQIYNYEIPGAEVLVEALSRQYDRVMGYAALQGTEAQWLGEKTGENSKVLGTTLAFNYADDIYAITVIDNRPGTYIQIRNSITKIVDHIVKNGGL
ncbi:MAG: class A beta-lactamase-related serine hydrolase [Oscillatoriaceae bacterium SKW80]|nr:class A beta-lactamase-related serine hydrolase [Oscillatoriaceae bacterium SKYG93]MCX8119857.1 class A beta-lactamase-related serine hydrolase [Oscillatoriaceae bacterium SKW80]MDW8452037.1 serine hydrolase [Oscillatoriaceae cyanobacterium SKYGB_i_bin93]HIK27522.1 serine hydrolase [Oscillatoriaceae cyanobacterium M7585_C2015_266]